jgi:uncharacterized protein YdeI (YjbR/CyaY-like superfamily)
MNKKPIKRTDSKVKGVKASPARIDASSAGTLHRMPSNLQTVLNSNKDVLAVWNTLTPLTKNEWICWVTIVKKEETRAKHLTQLCDDLRSGKRRPCCWPGCPHRRPSAQKWFGKKLK